MPTLTQTHSSSIVFGISSFIHKVVHNILLLNQRKVLFAPWTFRNTVKARWDTATAVKLLKCLSIQLFFIEQDINTIFYSLDKLRLDPQLQVDGVP